MDYKNSKKIFNRALLLTSALVFNLTPTLSVAALETGTVVFENLATPPLYFKANVNYEVFAPNDVTSPVVSASDYTYVYTLDNLAVAPPAGQINIPLDSLNIGVGPTASVNAASSVGAGIAPTSIDTSGASQVIFNFASPTFITPGSSSNQLIVQSPNGPGDVIGIVAFGSSNNDQIIRGPYTLPAKDFACFDINKVELEIKKNKTSKDKLKIQKGAISFNTGEGFDPATDIVKLSIDNGAYLISIPAGSFEQKGSKADYKYETGSGVLPKVKFRLNLDKGEWNVKIKYADLSGFTNAASIDVMLMVGDTKGQVTIPLTVDENSASEQELEFKRSPKFSCPKLRDDDSSIANDNGNGHGHHNRSCLSSFGVTYRKGLIDEEVISLFGGEIGHPSTTVKITAGSSTTFDTSCNQCLSCGDTDASGDFTITEISDATGKMTMQCGADPSCDMTTEP